MTQVEAVWKWSYHIPSMTREEIEWATQDTNWQSFRQSLKGLPTEQKLARLLSRYETAMRSQDDRNFHMVRVQVSNYINALRRGGQLDDRFNIRR